MPSPVQSSVIEARRVSLLTGQQPLTRVTNNGLREEGRDSPAPNLDVKVRAQLNQPCDSAETVSESLALQVDVLVFFLGELGLTSRDCISRRVGDFPTGWWLNSPFPE